MTEKVQKVTTVYEGRILNVIVEDVLLPTGRHTRREILRHRGAAAIVPMLDDGTVVLIRQYRHAIRDILWEIPAGTLEPGENPVECAKRELVEETGFGCSSLEKLTEIFPAPGYTNERIHIYLATKLLKAEQKLDVDESIEVHLVAMHKAVGMIRSGEIKDAKTITGLLLTYALIGSTHKGAPTLSDIEDISRKGGKIT